MFLLAISRHFILFQHQIIALQRYSIDDKMTKFVNNIKKMSVTNRGHFLDILFEVIQLYRT